MLDRIDPYGLLELTSIEMPQFLSELDVEASASQQVPRT